MPARKGCSFIITALCHWRIWDGYGRRFPRSEAPQLNKLFRANRIALFIAYIILSAGTIAALLPQLWMVACSFKPGGEIFSPPKSVIEARKKDPNGHPGIVRMTADLLTPDKPTVSNYKRLFTEVPFAQFFVNSLFVSTASTLLTLF